jgi:dephospho-CoA kinase
MHADRKNRSLHVGLTGGIACGKSHVSRFLSRLGSLVLDADQVARQVVQPGYPAYRKIIACFGTQVIQLSGELNRRLLASIIFADPAARKMLNEIVHPEVAQSVDAWLQSNECCCPPNPLFVEAALLVENGRHQKFDYLVVAHCSSETQIQRIMKRDTVDREMAEQRLRAQMPMEEKKRIADFLVDTSGPYRQTQSRILEIYSHLQRLPARLPPGPG